MNSSASLCIVAPVDVAMARKAAQRLTDVAFANRDRVTLEPIRPHFEIPANPNDDDLILVRALDELERLRAGGRRSGGVAGLGELERARAFFAAWSLASNLHEPDYTLRAGSTAEAVRSLAQALADEQEPGDVAELRAALEAARLERDDLAMALRRAVGVVQDHERTRSEAAAVLDDFARRGAFLPLRSENR